MNIPNAIPIYNDPLDVDDDPIDQDSFGWRLFIDGPGWHPLRDVHFASRAEAEDALNRVVGQVYHLNLSARLAAEAAANGDGLLAGCHWQTARDWRNLMEEIARFEAGR